MNVIFLHIPKTAGQSVHAFLEGLFDKDEVCPARENFQLYPYSLMELRRFRLFSGHLDWSLLDAVPAPRFVFTVLRSPEERILSFYFFLRRKASTFPPASLKLPEHHGLRAALNMAPDEYFCTSTGPFRTFIENLYDNFYTYYFAGRTFDARAKLRGAMRRANSPLTEQRIVDMAIDNLRQLDRVYTTESLDRLDSDLTALLGKNRDGRTLAALRVNAGEGDYSSRLDELRALGATEQTFRRISEMTRLDDKIWTTFCR